MKFPHLLKPSENLTVLRLGSTDLKWELGIRAVMYGRRVSLSKVGNHRYTLDYCAADDSDFTWHLLLAIQTILDRYDESISAPDLKKDFPRFQFKPISGDLAWGQLSKMAWGIDLPFIQCKTCRRVNYEMTAQVCPCCREDYPPIRFS